MFIMIDFEKNTGVLEIFTRHIFGLCVLAGLLGFAGFFFVCLGFLTCQVLSLPVLNVKFFFFFTI